MVSQDLAAFLWRKLIKNLLNVSLKSPTQSSNQGLTQLYRQYNTPKQNVGI
jgi:hypothetical protein